MATPVATTNLSSPRMRLVVNGVQIDGIIEASTNNNDNYAADSFTASVARRANNDPNWWLASTDQPVSIYYAFADSSGAVTWGAPIFQGIVDETSLDWDSAAISLKGRDLTARFIDTMTSKAYTNKTASQIVQALAAGHGIGADVTPTTRKAGALYDSDHQVITLDSFSHERSEWKLMTSLAQAEGYDLWVDSIANVVRFHPSVPLESAPVTYTIHAPPEDGSGNLWRYNDSSDYTIVENLIIDHNTNLAKGVGVIVSSFNSDKFASYSGKAGKTGPNDIPYKYVIPGLSKKACEDLANTRLKEIEAHTYRITWTEPGNITLTSRDVVQLLGTNTIADQKYHVESVTRNMHFEDGFGLEAVAKNMQPASSGGNGGE